jgi:hypothetical protein
LEKIIFALSSLPRQKSPYTAYVMERHISCRSTYNRRKQTADEPAVGLYLMAPNDKKDPEVSDGEYSVITLKTGG